MGRLNYLDDIRNLLARRGISNALELGDTQLLALVDGIDTVEDLLSIASNNSFEKAFDGDRLSWNERLVKKSQEDYNREYDERIERIYQLHLDTLSKEELSNVMDGGVTNA